MDEVKDPFPSSSQGWTSYLPALPPHPGTSFGHSAEEGRFAQGKEAFY